MCEIWAEVLGAKVSPYDDFFDRGGNSLKVIDVVIAARERGIALRSSAVFRNPTPARLAESLTVGRAAADSPSLSGAVRAALTAVLDDASHVGGRVGDPAGARFVIPAAASRTVEPLFLVLSSRFGAAERHAARSWEIGRAVYGLAARLDQQAEPPGTQTVTEISERLLADMRQVQPRGPYYMVGVGSGAVLAFEAARLLRRRAQQVARLVMIKPTAPGPPDDGRPTDFGDALRSQLAQLAGRLGLDGAESAAEIFGRMRAEGWHDDATDAALPGLLRASAAITVALSRYRPGSYDGPVVMLQDEMDAEAAEETWANVAADRTIHWFNYGLDCFGPLLRDSRVAEIMKKELLP